MEIYYRAVSQRDESWRSCKIGDVIGVRPCVSWDRKQCEVLWEIYCMYNVHCQILLIGTRGIVQSGQKQKRFIVFINIFTLVRHMNAQ